MQQQFCHSRGGLSANRVAQSTGGLVAAGGSLRKLNCCRTRAGGKMIWRCEAAKLALELI